MLRKVEAKADKESGYVPVCTLKFKDNRHLSEKEMKKWCKQYLRLIEIPRTFIVDQNLEFFHKK